MRTFLSYGVFALMVFVCGWGCSWQNTAHRVSLAPQYLRLSEQVWVSNALRWRLPAATAIVAVDQGLAPSNWITAANAGLNSIFDERGAQQKYRMQVHWPAPSVAVEENSQESFGAKLRDFITLPRTAATQVLTVKLFDQADHFVTTMDVHISPPLLGPDWHDEQVIQASFRHLAQSLRDG